MKRHTVYEHGKLNTAELSRGELHALDRWNERQRVRRFHWGHQSLRFSQWVGVLQVGRTTIEVLPKLDRQHQQTATPGVDSPCRDNLLAMMRKAGHLPLRHSGETGQQLRHMNLLELYQEYFLQGIERHLQRGVVKAYRQVRAERSFLRGRLLVSEQVQQSAAGPTRPSFLTEASTYDAQHTANALLASALELIQHTGTRQNLRDRARHLAVRWPARPVRPPVLAKHFDRLPRGRKLAAYDDVLPLARFLLLQLVPDFTAGQVPVVALMLDMNRLFEDYLRAELRRVARQQNLSLEVSNPKPLFWRATGAGKQKQLQTDIVLNWEDGINRRMVLDAKWKMPKEAADIPNDADLKQMFAYLHCIDASSALLLYPAAKLGPANDLDGHYHQHGELACGYRFLPLLSAENQLSDAWANTLLNALGSG